MAQLTAPLSVPRLDHAGVEAARLRLEARNQLAANEPSVTYELLAQARGGTEMAARQWVSRQRKGGHLITVDHGQTLIPSFQFDHNYQLVLEVCEAVKVLTRAGMSGWAIWRWFCTTSPWVGQRPVDLIGTTQLLDLVHTFVADSR
ncbi:MAG TPA: hypothetical protein PKV27_01060 [Ilumatobacteraceae bacterium]|nr:hypothetical protein [Ilumatobacteraceae bacterium]